MVRHGMTEGWTQGVSVGGQIHGMNLKVWTGLTKNRIYVKI